GTERRAHLSRWYPGSRSLPCATVGCGPTYAAAAKKTPPAERLPALSRPLLKKVALRPRRNYHGRQAIRGALPAGCQKIVSRSEPTWGIDTRRNAMTHPTPDTEELLRRVEEGDAEARDALLDRHRGRLRQLVALRMDPRLVARVDASDVVQETLVEADRRL